MSKYFLGVDPSLTNTAGVLLSAEGEIKHYFNSKHRDVCSVKLTDKNFEIKRLAEMGEFLKTELATVLTGNFDLVVCYENYSFGSTNRAFSLGELGGVLKTSLLLFTEDIHLVEPKRLKKFATWKANASKDCMMEQAVLEAPYLATIPAREFTNDLADAYFLAKYAWYMKDTKNAQAYETHREYLRRRIEVCLKTLKKSP